MALTTGNLRGYPQDRDEEEEGGQEQQCGFTQSTPQAATNCFTLFRFL